MLGRGASYPKVGVMPHWPQRLVGEDRVSIARWNPMGVRRSTGLSSMGAIPTRNRSAKEETRSSRHDGGEGVLVHSSYQGVCGRHGAED